MSDDKDQPLPSEMKAEDLETLMKAASAGGVDDSGCDHFGDLAPGGLRPGQALLDFWERWRPDLPSATLTPQVKDDFFLGLRALIGPHKHAAERASMAWERLANENLSLKMELAEVQRSLERFKRLIGDSDE